MARTTFFFAFYPCRVPSPIVQQAASIRNWPAFTSSSKQYLVLDTTLTTTDSYHSRKCHFWQEQFPQMLRTANNSRAAAPETHASKESPEIRSSAPESDFSSQSSHDGKPVESSVEAEPSEKSTEPIALILFGCLTVTFFTLLFINFVMS